MEKPGVWISAAVNISVALIIFISAWTVNAEYFHVGGIGLKSRESVDLPIKPSPEDLGLHEWTVGSIIFKEDQGAYQAVVVDAERRERFRILIDGKTGAPVEEREKKITHPIPVEEAIHSVEEILGSLSVGKVTRKQGKPFAQAELLYDGTGVSKIKVDPQTGETFDPDRRKNKGEGKNQKKKWKFRPIPYRAGILAGLIGTALAVGGTFYFTWRRSALRPFFMSPGTGGPARLMFDRTLTIHCRASFLALGMILLHVANDLMKIQWTTSWLAFAGILITSGSGMVGSSLIKTEAGGHLWRRFHRPVVVILFLLIAFHAGHQLELF